MAARFRLISVRAAIVCNIRTIESAFGRNLKSPIRRVGKHLYGVHPALFITVFLALAVPQPALAQAGDKGLEESRRVTRTVSAGDTVKTLEVLGRFAEPSKGSLGTVTSGGKTTPLSDDDSNGTVRFLFALPGQYRQDYSYIANDGYVLWLSTSARNGLDVWKKLDFPDSNLPPGAAVSHPPPGLVSLDEAKRKQIRDTEARLLLAFLLYTDPAFPIKFSYAGVAESPDAKADVFDGIGLDEFKVRLFLDSQTHLPVMLSYLDPPSLQDHQLRLGDYREAKGMLLPYLLSFSEDGQLTREIRIEKYEVNGKVPPGSFEKNTK